MSGGIYVITHKPEVQGIEDAWFSCRCNATSDTRPNRRSAQFGSSGDILKTTSASSDGTLNPVRDWDHRLIKTPVFRQDNVGSTH